MLIITGSIETSTQARFDCCFDSSFAPTLLETSHRFDLIVGLIRLLLQQLCVVCLPELLEFDGLVAAGGGGGAAGGNACTGGST